MVNKRDLLVNVATAPNEIVAQMWVQILNYEGICCLMKIGTVAGDFFSLFTRMGPSVGIYVLAAEAEKSKEILDSLEEPPPY
jgi:hypothetical protein